MSNYEDMFKNESILTGLTQITNSAKIKGILTEVTTADISSAAMRIFVNLGIHEAESFFIFPVTVDGSREKRITRVAAFLYLDVSGKNVSSEKERNIYRIDNDNSGDRNDYNIFDFIQNKSPQGPVKMSDEFKKKMFIFAQFDNQGEFIIESDKKHPDIYVMEIDLESVLAVMYNATEKSLYSCSIVGCTTLNSGKNSTPNYLLQVIKRFDGPKKNNGRNNKNNNYDVSNRAIMERLTHGGFGR